MDQVQQERLRDMGASGIGYSAPLTFDQRRAFDQGRIDAQWKEIWAAPVFTPSDSQSNRSSSSSSSLKNDETFFHRSPTSTSTTKRARSTSSYGSHDSNVHSDSSRLPAASYSTEVGFGRAVKNCLKALAWSSAILAGLIWIGTDTANTPAADPLASDVESKVMVPPRVAKTPVAHASPTLYEGFSAATPTETSLTSASQMRAVSPPAPPVELRVPDARHQVFGRDHHGELVFTDTSFRFESPGVQTLLVNRTDVAKVDKNGVKLFTKIDGRDRYHFGSDHMTSEEIRELFSRWFEQ